jgi:dipeptidyl aminopeptidase/acylaminoacyl peptidase
MWVWMGWVIAAGATTWQQPPEAILEVLHAAEMPSTWTSPDGRHALLMQRETYPPLADRAAAMVPLAGIRVDARTHGYHGRRGYTGPHLLDLEDGEDTAVDVGDARVLGVAWSADGERLALSLKREDHIGLWVGSTDGRGSVVEGLELNPLLGASMRWLPDQDRLLVKRVPDSRGPIPEAPLIPEGPDTRSGDGDSAISTYEARDLLKSAHDEALFTYYATGELAVVDAESLEVTPVGAPDVFSKAVPSPNGAFLLVERVRPPWSQRHAWWRFGSVTEVWKMDGTVVHTVASLDLHDSVPIHGVPMGPRSISWRASAPSTLVWIEALDGGDWSAEVPFRDELWMQKAPFKRAPVSVFKAEHRIRSLWWGEKAGLAVVEQYERARRWRHVWQLSVDKRSSRAWFDLSTNDRYLDPGRPLTQWLDNGTRVLLEDDGDVFFAGRGASPDGDRPFVDRRSLSSDRVDRLFRSGVDGYERFDSWLDVEAGTFLMWRESPIEPPNLYTATLGEPVDAEAGEATRSREMHAVTRFTDPTPQLRAIERRIVTYEREDGTPLSFTLYLPPDYEEGTALPTVVYAYPREFSDPATAGQVRGSKETFTRFGGPSHLFFLLQGYAVLHNTRMPVIGDPDTAYDTFVEQLVSGAEAAVAKAVEMGVTDPDRVGVMGHSHGGLMTVTLLAHSDLFQAGIARSGAYNHTIRPFGFQSERRTLWEATESYLHLSPVMHAPKINEPLLLIHGAIDENPGTVALQSERLFEAVRGVGGTVRWVSLPHEGHGYRARESVEHVLWEQLRWFDTHVKGVE